jgi:hypothetical protein
VCDTIAARRVQEQAAWNTKHRDLERAKTATAAQVVTTEREKGEARVRVVEARTKAAETLQGATDALPAAKQAMDDAETAHKAARDHLQEVSAAVLARPDWTRAKSALGAEPLDLPEILRPDCDSPTAEEVEAARAIVDADTAANSAATYADDVKERAERAVEVARAKLRNTNAAHERAEALVTAIRGAPAKLLPYAVQALGDLGPVAIQPDGDGCRVLIAGWPWREASAGQLIHADLHLRLALRRALGCPWLPVVVDNVQDWSGAWPEVAGPSIWLETKGGNHA